MTEYMHGTSHSGELDENGQQTSYLPMSPAKPTDSNPKSMSVTSYGLGPDPSCAGSHEVPTWVVAANGTLVAPPADTLTALSNFGVTVDQGGVVEIRLYADVVPETCEATTFYGRDPSEPIAAATIALPVILKAITTTLALARPRPTFKHNLLLQISPVPAPVFTGRVLYDSTGYPSQIILRCARRATGSRC